MAIADHGMAIAAVSFALETRYMQAQALLPHKPAEVETYKQWKRVPRASPATQPIMTRSRRLVTKPRQSKVARLTRDRSRQRRRTMLMVIRSNGYQSSSVGQLQAGAFDVDAHPT